MTQTLVLVAHYADRRRLEYPPLADYVDAQFWAQQGDTTKLEAYFAKVALVKARFPKPEKTE